MPSVPTSELSFPRRTWCRRPRVRLVLAAVAVALTGCGGDEAEEETEPEPPPSTYASKVLGALDRTTIERTRQDMLAVRAAAGSYLASGEELPENLDYAKLKRLLVPTYIKRLPENDAWGHGFILSGGATSWTLTAPGIDGQVGTGDDLVLTDVGFQQLPEGFRDHL